MVYDPDRLRRCEESAAADLLELFTSVQGEGHRVGERHTFVRLGHCDIQCAYCDTPKSHRTPRRGRIETLPGQGQFRFVENPYPVAALAEDLDAVLRSARPRAVSFTGGEPLLQPWVIEHLSPLVRGAGVAVLLETDGNLPDAFRRVLSSVDILSLDWKVPSATGEPLRGDAHRAMLSLSAGLEACVKLVFVESTEAEEVEEAAKSVAASRPDIPFILQPCTPMGTVRQAPSPARGFFLADQARRYLDDVRVIPQVHRMLDVL